MMDLYLLNSDYVPVELIEEYETSVWTERFFTPGEIEITTLPTPENKEQLRVGSYLGTNLSPRIMVVETAEVGVGEDGKRVLKATGRSMERIFEKRVARHHYLMLDDDEVWKFETVVPHEIMRTLVTDICLEGVLSTEDIIPKLRKAWDHDDLYYNTDSAMPFPHIPIDIEFPLMSLSEALAEMNEKYDLGHRLFRNPNNDDGYLYFDIYSGTDRTMLQNSVDPVVFSLPWGTLESMSDLDSIANYYNTIYVFSDYGKTTVSRSNTRSGLDRNVLYLTVNDEISRQLTGTPLTNYLKQKGEEALKEYEREALFEGEVPHGSPYLYNRDYFLGDHVDLLGEDNVGAKMMVVENIFTIDSDGFRSFPTFQMVEHIDPDSWSGLRGGEIWATIPGYWNDY